MQGECVLIRRGTPGDVPALVGIWRRSVEATHKFLTEKDVALLQPQVAGALGGMEVWVAEIAGAPAGFMGMGGDSIEALFIDPPSMGMRLGTRFIDHARATRGARAELRVDVNEDNPEALGFYLSRGFRQVGRSETDQAGRPWPLLHLAMPAQSAE